MRVWVSGWTLILIAIKNNHNLNSISKDLDTSIIWTFICADSCGYSWCFLPEKKSFALFLFHYRIQMRSEYLALTHLVLTNSCYFEHCHRLDEIKECLDRILHEEEDVPLDKDIATRISTRLKEFSTWTIGVMFAWLVLTNVQSDWHASADLDTFC